MTSISVIRHPSSIKHRWSYIFGEYISFIIYFDFEICCSFGKCTESEIIKIMHLSLSLSLSLSFSHTITPIGILRFCSIIIIYLLGILYHFIFSLSLGLPVLYFIMFIIFILKCARYSHTRIPKVHAIPVYECENIKMMHLSLSLSLYYVFVRYSQTYFKECSLFTNKNHKQYSNKSWYSDKCVNDYSLSDRAVCGLSGGSRGAVRNGLIHE